MRRRTDIRHQEREEKGEQISHTDHRRIHGLMTEAAKGVHAEKRKTNGKQRGLLTSDAVSEKERRSQAGLGSRSPEMTYRCFCAWGN
jgi:hypothetical protein